MKKCTKHHLNFPGEDSYFPATSEYFYRASRNVDGLKTMCKRCAEKYKATHKRRRSFRFKSKHEDEKRRVRGGKIAEEGMERLNVKCYNSEDGCKNETIIMVAEGTKYFHWVCAECKELGSPKYVSELDNDSGTWSDGKSVEKLDEEHMKVMLDNGTLKIYNKDTPGFEELAKLYGRK